MFEVAFYEDRHGCQPVKEVLIELRDKALQTKMLEYSIKKS
jgi:hypothetical protein